MSYSQIRINKTKDLQEVLSYLKNRMKVFSEAELCKIFLVEGYLRLKEREDVLDRTDIGKEEVLFRASDVFQINESEPDNIADSSQLIPVTFKDEV